MTLPVKLMAIVVATVPIVSLEDMDVLRTVLAALLRIIPPYCVVNAVAVCRLLGVLHRESTIVPDILAP